MLCRQQVRCVIYAPLIFFFFKFVFDFCRFCVVIWFFHPRHNSQWPPTSKDFYTRSYPLHDFLILILEKEPVFPFSMLSAKQGNSWYHFYFVFGMTRSLTGDWTRTFRTRSQQSTTRLSRRHVPLWQFNSFFKTTYIVTFILSRCFVTSFL